MKCEEAIGANWRQTGGDTVGTPQTERSTHHWPNHFEMGFYVAARVDLL